MTLSEAFDAYRRNVIQFGNQSPRTEEHHNLALKSLLRFLERDKPIELLMFEEVRDWKNSMTERGMSIGTIYGYIVRLRCVLTYTLKNGGKCLNPDTIKPPKRPRQHAPTFLTEDEVSMLIAAATKLRGRFPAKRAAAIISLMYSSGVRVGELVAMNVSDAFYDTFVAHGKGDKDRPCFIDPRARYYLNEYMKVRRSDDAALFVAERTGERISKDMVQLIMRNLKAKTGISKKATPHVMRHSFATNFLRNNGNLRNLQVMLGHESIETTQMYTHVVDNDLALAHAQFHTLVAPIQPTQLPQAAWRPA